jgi:transposase
LRDLTRYRTTLSQERAQLSNRLHKLLEEANLKLSSVISELLGKSGRLILAALANGETDPEKLADLALPCLMKKRAALVQALSGRLREHHRFLLRELLDAIEYLDRAIARLDQRIEEHVRPFQETIERLDEITGIGRGCLETLFAEIGVDVTPFPDAAHLGNARRVMSGQS